MNQSNNRITNTTSSPTTEFLRNNAAEGKKSTEKLITYVRLSKDSPLQLSPDLAAFISN